MPNFKDRIIWAAKLGVNLYEEVEADKGAMRQAMGIVALSGVAAGIGTIATRGHWCHYRDNLGDYWVAYMGVSYLLDWNKATSEGSDQGGCR